MVSNIWRFSENKEKICRQTDKAARMKAELSENLTKRLALSHMSSMLGEVSKQKKRRRSF